MYKQRQEGFTIIELLAVIAIISLLMAITFPVVSAVKRKNLETRCMTNMSQIFAATKAFQQDQHCYPEFIAGPAQWQIEHDSSGNVVLDTDGNPVIKKDSDGLPLVRPMNRCTGTLDNVAVLDNTNKPVLLYPNPTSAPVGQMVSLYPEYIRSAEGLNCGTPGAEIPWNPYVSRETNDDEQNNKFYVVVRDPMFPILTEMDSLTRPLSSRRLVQDGSSYQLLLYAYSSYDFQVSSQKDIQPGNIDGYGEAHYCNTWTNNSGLDGDENDYTAQQYVRQLHWKNPPEDSIITWCGAHVSNSAGNYIVVFLDGRAQRFNAGVLKTLVDQTTKDYAGEPDWMCMWHVAPQK